jgi:hypothetical protein
VTAIDDDEGTVEIQHFDGDVEEMDLDDWRELDLEAIEPPADWTGPVDDVERDDLGYTETEMRPEDWSEPLEEKVKPAEETEEEEERREE